MVQVPPAVPPECKWRVAANFQKRNLTNSIFLCKFATINKRQCESKSKANSARL